MMIYVRKMTAAETLLPVKQTELGYQVRENLDASLCTNGILCDFELENA